MTSLVGQAVGHYHILEQIGTGGMAIVYKAYDTRLEREVAIKIIRRKSFPEDQLERMLKRFEREAKALAKLSHPNIVKILEYGEHEGVPYLVMEYLSGGTLKERLRNPMPWQETVELLIAVAQALDYAHEHHVIHRDIKPSNILLTEKGQPMLTDFGIAKMLETEETATLTGTGVGVGTPEYMAPEQGRGLTDARSDIYSLGIVLYEMVTGRKPFVADTPLAMVLMHISDPLPSPRQFVPKLPVEMERILLKALAKKPEDRYQNMGEFAKALKKMLLTKAQKEKKFLVPDRSANSASKGAVVKRLGTGRQFKSWWIWALGILVVLAGSILVYSSMGNAKTSITSGSSPALQAGITPANEILSSPISVTKTYFVEPTSSPTSIPTPKPSLQYTATQNISSAFKKISVDNVEKLELLTKLKMDGDIKKIVISPDSKTLAVSMQNNTIQLWNLSTMTRMNTITYSTGLIVDLLFQNDNLIATTCTNSTCDSGGEIIYWQLSDQTLINKIELPDPVITVSNMDEVVVAHYLGVAKTTNSHGKVENHPKWEIQLCVIKNGALVKLETLSTFIPGGDSNWLEQGFPQPAFSLDGNSFAFPIGESVMMRQGSDVKNTKDLQGTWNYSWVEFSNDGNLLAASDNYRNIQIWNTANETLLQEIKTSHSGEAGYSAFSPDSTLIVAAGGIWSVADGKLVNSKPFTSEFANYSTRSIAFSPDGIYIATGGINASYIYIWGMR